MGLSVAGCGKAWPINDHICSWLWKGLSYKWSYLYPVVERHGVKMVIFVVCCGKAWPRNDHICSWLWKGFVYK
jgi:predicted nucleic acid-binding Zn ribbon protein